MVPGLDLEDTMSDENGVGNAFPDSSKALIPHMSAGAGSPRARRGVGGMAGKFGRGGRRRRGGAARKAKVKRPKTARAPSTSKLTETMNNGLSNLIADRPQNGKTLHRVSQSALSIRPQNGKGSWIRQAAPHLIVETESKESDPFSGINIVYSDDIGGNRMDSADIELVEHRKDGDTTNDYLSRTQTLSQTANTKSSHTTHLEPDEMEEELNRVLNALDVDTLRMDKHESYQL